MEIRTLLANYLTDKFVKDGEVTLPAEGPYDLMASARKDLPKPYADRLVHEYQRAANSRAAKADTDQDLNELLSSQGFDGPEFIDNIIKRLKAKPSMKDARASVTYYPDSGSARVTFHVHGWGFSEATVRSADELWKLLKKAATEGIDIPAAPPAPYITESPEEWLKTHRPTRAQQRKLYDGSQPQQAQRPPRQKKPSMALEAILKLDLKL